ncbi:MAG: glycoside hydrolase family 43 protein, partial [Oscillospiraceae bacterium]|nr:glycoside hydrolase family 43 protein [Oscillospiraceae bacterium]
FHADPSMIFVDDTFYIANSTFEWYPGVKISKSKDLVNFTNVNYPLNRDGLLNMEGTPKGTGVWAPCLSYANGLFYLVYSDLKEWAGDAFKDASNYITTSKSIDGPWSDPVYINSSGFDPSLFHDDDKMYFLNMEWDYRNKKGSEQFTGIILTELDKDSLKPVSKPVKIFKGSKKGSVEGPHIYKKDGYYYLFTAEGGTEYEHAETVARSKNIYGPYEIHPNIYISCAEDFKDAKLQKTGHGSIAQSQDGRWWYACLCGRPLEGTKFCPLGRETAINEVIWEDGWPYLKNKTILMDEYFEGYGEKIPDKEIFYDFSIYDDSRFKLDFQSLRSKASYDFVSDKLRIYGGNSPSCNFKQNILARRQMHFKFEAETLVKVYSENFQQMAGLIYRYDESTYYFLNIYHDEDLNKNVLSLMCMVGDKFHIPFDKIIVESEEVFLKISVIDKIGKFSYSSDGDDFIDIDYNIDTATLSDEFANPQGFTGAFIGMQCVDLFNKLSFADFSYFKYSPRE